jgi:hypothetical protein
MQKDNVTENRRRDHGIINDEGTNETAYNFDDGGKPFRHFE